MGGYMNRRDFLKGCPVIVGSLVVGGIVEGRVNNPGECCSKWKGAEAVPTFSMAEDSLEQYWKRDVVKYCPVCGMDFQLNNEGGTNHGMASGSTKTA